MKAKTIIAVLVMSFVAVQAGWAEGKEGIQKYFNDAAQNVKMTADPEQKREILHHSFQTMSKALDQVESSGLVSKDDRDGIKRIKTALQEKQDELTGDNGYERVADAQLNAFSDYVVQDMEQAYQSVTISLVSALLIIIILILIL
jgi:hypothetical protein